MFLAHAATVIFHDATLFLREAFLAMFPDLCQDLVCRLFCFLICVRVVYLESWFTLEQVLAGQATQPTQIPPQQKISTGKASPRQRLISIC